MADAFTPESPYLAILHDNHGRTWQFAYWGSGFVYIRETIDDGTPDVQPVMGDRASRNDWPYLIGIGDCIGMTPERVTARWLGKRAASWIADRNNENPQDTP